MAIIDQFRILDLFCGAGGMSYGMHQNGHFVTAVALDFNEKAANTFKQNMPDTHVVTGDITSERVKREVVRTALGRRVNMIIGGPPCQGFSMKGKKLGLADERNYLFREYLRIVEEIRPEVFVIENVKSLLTTAGGWFRDEILSYIRALGYKVRYGVLNARDYGVPQSRERAIFICSRTRTVPLPRRCVARETTVRDAISDLAYLQSGEGSFEADYTTQPQSAYQRMMRAGAERLYNHKASNHAKVALDKLAMIPPEGSKKSLPEALRGRQKFNTTWGRLRWNEVSPTIDTRFDTPSNGTNSHPELNRAITPREAARLQSFGDAFVFHGNKVSIRTQIGNAVPPLMAKAIADAIWGAYRGNLLFGSRSDEHEQALGEAFKKSHGIFYTDIDLSKDVVDFLNIPVEASCIDPWCGTGSFVYSLKRTGRVRQVYGCDFDADTVAKCRELTQSGTIYCLDTLAHTGNEVLEQMGRPRFDCLVSNPPYAPITKDVTIGGDKRFLRQVRSAGCNLYIAALYRAFEYVKPEGIISVVIPKNFLHISSYKAIRQYILREKNILSIIELGIHFKTVRGEQIVLTMQNAHSNGNVVRFYDYNDGDITYLSEIRQSFFEDEVIVFTSEADIRLYNKLRDTRAYRSVDDLCVRPIHRGHSKAAEAVRGKQIRKLGFRDRPLPTEGSQLFVQNIFSAEAGLTATYAGNAEAGETVTILDAKPHQEKYLLGLLCSRICNYYLIRFLFNNSRLTIHTDGNYLGRIPIPHANLHEPEVSAIVEQMERVPYMEREWFELNEQLNNIVYTLYGLTPEERRHVETEMREISASKWYNKTEQL